MDRKELIEMLRQIKPLDEEAMAAARERQERLAKPPGSLGKLEDISIQIAGITGKVKNDVTKQAIVIMAADNGVCEEGIASAPQTVTRAQTINFTKRVTGVSALAEHFGVDLLVVDVGVKEAIPAGLYTDSPALAVTARKILNRKVAAGTANLAQAPAMPTPEALRCLAIGIEATAALRENGCQLVGVGEMGIGNTTTSAAVLSALTGEPAVRTVGKGGGLSETAFAHKRKIVDDACHRYGFSHQENPDVIEVLAKVGGYDIAAMAGVFLGAAIYRIPVVIDGYISAVAALAASKLYEQIMKEIGDENVQRGDGFGTNLANANATFGEHFASQRKCLALTNFMIASHKSHERGYEIAMNALWLEPMLLLGMRLGEGSGCPIAFKVVEAACAAMCGMATFEEAEINDEYLEDIRQKDSF